MKTPPGMEVDHGAGHIILDGVPALRERGTAAPSFRPMFIVATVAHLSYCWALVNVLMPDWCYYSYTVCWECWFTAKWPLFSYCLPVCLSVCLFVCAVFLSRLWSDFDQTRTYICLGLVVSPRIEGLCDPWGLVTPKKLVFLGFFGLKKLTCPTVLIGLCWVLVIL